MVFHIPTRSSSNGAKALATIAAALAFASAAWPAAAEDGFADLAKLDASGARVPDEQLAEIRGKFIKPESISFFGISMITSWEDASGVTTVARLAFNVDFLADGSGGDPVPTLMVGWVREGDPSMDVTQSHAGYVPVAIAGDIAPVAGLGETSGAAQANIIAGADNSALNGLRIALIPSSSLPEFNGEGLSPISATSTQGFADGDQLEFRLGANELGLILTGNHGADSTLQSAGGDFGRMLQQTVLNSDGNSVLNNAAIVIGTDPAAQSFDAIRATEALSAMKGHGF